MDDVLATFDYDDISREQAIELLRLHEFDMAKRDVLETVIVEKLTASTLTAEQARDMNIFINASVYQRHCFATGIKFVLGMRETLN